MKKLLIYFFCFAGCVSAAAQTTNISIVNNEDLSAGVCEVFYYGKLLGKTDIKGTFSINQIISCDGLVIQQKENIRTYDIIDSAITEKERNYKLQLHPKSIEEVIVQVSRANARAPISSSAISDIESQNTGRDIPVLLQFQPGVTVTTDAGAGVGYTGIRIRGSDATRTNVTVNGVPINDAESHATFWVNMPDLASSISSIQLTSGVGSSTNGAGAFGASLNLQTASSSKAYGTLSNTAGSFGTMRNSIAAGTGLINGHWSVDLRLSQIRSNGFVDRASSRLQSHLFSVGYASEKWNLKFLSFGGKERTYQAWWGVPLEKYNNDAEGLMNHYYRNLGVTYKTEQDSVNLFGSNPSTYNYYTYQNEVDNYNQNHYHLYFSHKTGKKSGMNATLYYTRGFGYFEQYRFKDKVSNYGFSPFVIGSDTITRSDLIRQRWLDNHLIGINANWYYRDRNWDVIAGFGYNNYRGYHYGKVIWAELMPAAAHESSYYNSRGHKTDGNAFVKATRKVLKNTYVWADLQIRSVSHNSIGFDNDLRDVYFSRKFSFFNPKLGISHFQGQNHFYARWAVANREPSRSDITDNRLNETPRPERLSNIEAGWNRNTNKSRMGLNFYYMGYKNQLVLTGEVNDVGSALKRNVAESYRAGIEAVCDTRISNILAVGANFALSRNIIREIVNVIPDYFTYINKDTIFRNVPIAMSPGVNAAAWLSVMLPGQFQIRYLQKYVGRQFLDNTGDKYRSLNPYFFSELWFNKTLKLKTGGELEFQFQVLNLFNTRYASNGYTFMYTYGTPDITQEVFLYPQAGRNYLGGLALKF